MDYFQEHGGFNPSRSTMCLLVFEAVRWSHRLGEDGGMGDGGLGLADCVIVDGPEFPTPYSCSP